MHKLKLSKKNTILPQTNSMNYSHYPVLKVLLPYVFGIITGYLLPINSLNMLFCILGLFFFGIIFILFRHKKNFFLHKIITCLMIFSFCFAGYLSVFFHFHKNLENLNMDKITQKQTWIAEIQELPKEREKSFKVIARLTAVNDSSYWTTKKVILYFQKDSVIKKGSVGDKLMIYTKLSFIEPPKNPEQFNYEKLMRKRGIFLTGYVGKKNWTQMECTKSVTLKSYTSYLQRYLSHQLLASGMSGATYSVAAAILLGNDETLEPELRASYAATGVSHILCVSGMHVGVIFMILSFLLKPLDYSVKTRYPKNVTLLIAVWVYASITGLAPSVTRSAAMFTFVITGTFLQRRTNIFHSLFASLFILLVFNPLLLFEVGFQLSYLAVFGIVLFQKKISEWFQPKTKVVKYVWDLITVSVSAQIFTSPIAIYYFGQFPNYFLLTNLFVIPLSFVVVILGVATLTFSFSSFISNDLGFLLHFSIKTMNEIIMCIEKLPGAITQNISIHFTQVIVLYALVVCIIVCNKNIKKLIMTAFCLMNIFLLIRNYDRIKCNQNIEVISYNISKVAAFQFCHQGSALIVSDSIQNENDKRYQLNIKNHDVKMRLKNSFIPLNEDYENEFLCKKGNCIFFQNTIYVLEKNKLKPNIVELVVYNNNFSERRMQKLK